MRQITKDLNSVNVGRIHLGTKNFSLFIIPMFLEIEVFCYPINVIFPGYVLVNTEFLGLTTAKISRFQKYPCHKIYRVEGRVYQFSIILLKLYCEYVKFGVIS